MSQVVFRRAALDLKSAMLWCCGLIQISASASVQSMQSSYLHLLVVPKLIGARLFLCSGTLQILVSKCWRSAVHNCIA